MKNRTVAFSILGSLLIVAFAFVTNYLTSWGHPWFIYPTFAVIWWPFGVYFAQNKRYKVFSVVGALWISAFFILLNRIVSPGYIWCIYPIFAVLWWPLSYIICGAKKYKLYSVVMTLLTIAFFAAVNYLTTPGVLWFIYPAFAIAWWPLSYIICGAKKFKLYSVVMSLLTVAFFAAVNYMYTPHYLWFYYPAFAIAWWPLSMLFAKKKFIKLYSIVMSLTTLGFLALVNYINTPSIWWFQYTAFYLMWWPLVMYLGKRAKKLAFAIISCAVIIAYHVAMNFLLTPDFPWFLYMILPAIWWPVSVAFKEKAKTGRYFLVSVSIFLAYYIVLNLIIAPTYAWVPYLTYPALWLALGVLYYKKNRPLGFSISAFIITAAFFIALNIVHTPNHIWAVYPIFAIMWWPLSVYFYRKKPKQKIAE